MPVQAINNAFPEWRIEGKNKQEEGVTLLLPYRPAVATAILNPRSGGQIDGDITTMVLMQELLAGGIFKIIMTMLLVQVLQEIYGNK